jgi:hypothetical protein
MKNLIDNVKTQEPGLQWIYKMSSNPLDNDNYWNNKQNLKIIKASRRYIRRMF